MGDAISQNGMLLSIFIIIIMDYWDICQYGISAAKCVPKWNAFIALGDRYVSKYEEAASLTPPLSNAR
jgi:hypothetical protein